VKRVGKYFVALILGLTNGHVASAAAPPRNPRALPPLELTLVRSNASGCASDCIEWIAAQGPIGIGSARAFAKFIAKLGDRRMPVLINSPGGSVNDAIEIGRLIRAKGLSVVVARTTLDACADNAKTCDDRRGQADGFGAHCASACTLVLAGGVDRFVSHWGRYVGVHHTTEFQTRTQILRRYRVLYRIVGGKRHEVSRTLVSESSRTTMTQNADSPVINKKISGYLADMGVGEPLMQLMLATAATDIHWMDNDELKRSHLATFWLAYDHAFSEDANDQGLRAEPVDPTLGAAVVNALLTTPLNAPPNDRAAKLQTALHYRRGGAAVRATFSLSDAQNGKPLSDAGSDYAIRARFDRAETLLGATANRAEARADIPLATFCRLRDSGRLELKFVDTSVRTSNATKEPALALILPVFEAVRPVFDAACGTRQEAKARR
jgi:hypothetical protein